MQNVSIIIWVIVLKDYCLIIIRLFWYLGEKYGVKKFFELLL